MPTSVPSASAVASLEAEPVALVLEAAADVELADQEVRDVHRGSLASLGRRPRHPRYMTDLFRILVVIFLAMHGIGHLLWFLAAWTPMGQGLRDRRAGSCPAR